MKKTKFIIPLAASILLASCSTGGTISSSLSQASSNQESISSSSSLSSSSDSPISSSTSEIISSSSSEDASVSIDKIETYAKAFTSKQSGISSGTIKKKTASKYEDTTTDYTFTYGSDSNGDTLKVNDGTSDTYIMKNSSGQVLTVNTNSSGDYQQAPSSDSYSSIAPHFKGYLEKRESYGVEGFFSDLVEAAKSNVNNNFSAKTKNGKIVFDFGYFEDDKPLTYYAVSVSFLPSEEALTVLNLTISQYASSAFTYDETTKLVTLKSSATTSQVDTYKIAQNVGGRTYTNDIDLTSFEYQSLSFKDSSGTVISESNPVSMKKGGYYPLTLVSSPSTASLRFDSPIISVLSGGSADAITGSFVRMNNGSKEELTIHANEAGTFVVQVKTKNCATTFKVDVMDTKPTSMSTRLYTYNDFDEEYNSTQVGNGETITTYVGVSSYFSPYFNPKGSDDSFTAKVKYSDGTKADKSSYTLNKEDTITIYDDDIDVISFTGKKEGEYTLTIASETDSTVLETFTIKVLEANFKNALSSTYGVRYKGTGDIQYTFEFTPDSSSDTTGSVIITDKSTNTVTNTTYSINAVGGMGYYQFSFDASVSFSLYIDSSYNLYTIFDADTYRVYPTSSIDLMMPKEWVGSDEDGDYTVNYLTFNNDGTLEGSIQDNEYILECEYSVSKNEDGSYTISLNETDYIYASHDWFNSLPSTMTLNSSMDEITFTSDYFEADFTLAVSNN